MANNFLIASGVTLIVACKLRIWRGFLDATSSRIDRYSKAEIKILSTAPVSDLQKDVDALSKELREVNEKIQELNWTTALK